jgi:hypothetical protein
MCNTPINIFLALAILILIFLWFITCKKMENFSAGGYNSCLHNQVSVLKNTCVPIGTEVKSGLIKPSEYKDPDKIDRCHAYDTRYDFSKPSNLFIKLG